MALVLAWKTGGSVNTLTPYNTDGDISLEDIRNVFVAQ
jgi:hypothetical protein